MKTMLELAQELHVPKLKIYRYIKKRFIETHQENGVIYLDETAEVQIKKAMQNDGPYQPYRDDTHREIPSDTANDTATIRLLQETIGALKQQLDVKDKQLEKKDQQVEELIAALAAAQENIKVSQALHVGTMQKQLTDSKQKLKERLLRIFGKKITNET